MRKQKAKVSSKGVKVKKYLAGLASDLIGPEKPYSSLANFADSAFKNELEKRGVKV